MTEREQFEAWASNYPMRPAGWTEACWNAWQAGRASAVPEGYVLVPVEPTQRMKTAGINVEVYQDSPPEPGSLTWEEVRAVYQAMLAAAPSKEGK